MRITLTVSNPEVEAEDLRLVSLEVFPEMTIEALRSSIEAEGIPEPSQHIYHNGQLITDKSKTIHDIGITDGDMLALHIRDMRGNTGVAPGPRAQQQPPQQQQQHQQQQQQQQQHQHQQRSAMSQDPELIRLQVLGDPRLRAELQRSNPQLAAALDDSRRFAQLIRDTTNQQEDARRARMREIEQLNNDEFNPEAQARIEEMIRQNNVMENLQNAMEYNPESFGRVHLLYIDVKVNGVKVKALVDSGAQATIMSPDCAEACHIMHLVDKRFAGVARGIGTAAIIGRVHYTTLQVGSRHLPASFTVMEGKSVDLLLGLDILKGHQATIDLARNKLIIQGEEVDFLGEADVPKETEEAVNQEPTVPGPGGTTIGARSGAVTVGPSAPTNTAVQQSNTSSSSSSSATARSPAPIQTPRPSAPSGAGAPQLPTRTAAASSFPESDIQTLMDLGATRQRAIQALEFTGGNVEFAANVIFAEM